MFYELSILVCNIHLLNFNELPNKTQVRKSYELKLIQTTNYELDSF